MFTNFPKSAPRDLGGSLLTHTRIWWASNLITIFINLWFFSAFLDSDKYKNMDKITHILENVVSCKYFETGVHIKNPIKSSYQDGLGRTIQTSYHVVVVHILIWDKRMSQITEYSDPTWKLTLRRSIVSGFRKGCGKFWLHLIPADSWPCIEWAPQEDMLRHDSMATDWCSWPDAQCALIIKVHLIVSSFSLLQTIWIIRHSYLGTLKILNYSKKKKKNFMHDLLI